MIKQDPNLAMVESIAAALGPLRERLIFVGGCAVGLLLSDPAAAPARVTYDVDVLAEVAALQNYHRLESELSSLGFQRDMTKDAPICRWRLGEIQVDLMPSEVGVLGFANRWYPLVVQTCQQRTLPSGLAIRLITAPAFIATKFDAFSDRGLGDVLVSHDLEDIVTVLDGRPELLDELMSAPDDLRKYIADRCRVLLSDPSFLNALPGLLLPDESHAKRFAIVIQRLERIAAIS